jgi:DNA-binding response OmpR family regulator
MRETYLAIERDMAVHERESQFWLSRNVSAVRVSSMTEGIEAAMKHRFLYIGINAANINYQPQLPLLREVTNDPIFISTTTYTMQEQGVAVRLGADLFGQISENPEDNYSVVMDNINALYERSKRQKIPPMLIPYGNILLSYTHRLVFVDDATVELSKLEFDMLYFFLNHRGHALSFKQIYHHVWGDVYDESITASVKSTMKRLRDKIDGEDADNSFIESIRGVGYRLRFINGRRPG